MIIKHKGGRVIASGGFGCVFYPSLKCEKQDFIDNNKISKLMTNKHAQDEYNQINKYKHILNVIPNYEQYFLLNDVVLCKPDKLTTENLNGYKKKCKALKKKGITYQNINKSLDKILTINMPNGGINVKQFIQHYFVSSNIIKLNNTLIDLLVNGIVPMNKLNVYHCDIKEANVLVQVNQTTLITRLIDWGLSISISNNSGKIPLKLYRRPFQFNVPFSSILFNKDFMELYNNFLELNLNPDYFQIREFVINYIFIWNDIRGPGHLSTINNIIEKFTIKHLTAIKKTQVKEHFIEYDFTYYYIIEYLSKILEKYTNNGSLDIMSYFENVFLKNIDIWGFIMIYIALYEYLYNTFDDLNEYQIEFIAKIKYIIIHFLYENPLEPINVSSLVNELTNLNTIIDKFNINNSSTKLENNIGGFSKITKSNKNKLTKKKNKTNKLTKKKNKTNKLTKKLVKRR
jgi:hypothetical protein